MSNGYSIFRMDRAFVFHTLRNVLHLFIGYKNCLYITYRQAVVNKNASVSIAVKRDVKSVYYCDHLSSAFHKFYLCWTNI